MISLNLIRSNLVWKNSSEQGSNLTSSPVISLPTRQVTKMWTNTQVSSSILQSSALQMCFSKQEGTSFWKYLKGKIFVILPKRYKSVIQNLPSTNPLPAVIGALRNMWFVFEKNKASYFISETEAPCPWKGKGFRLGLYFSMTLLDIILIFLGLSAGIGSFITGTDTLFKLFFGLIIGFLSYLVVSYQIELTSYIDEKIWDGYQSFLAEHALLILSIGIILIPIMWLFFMLQQRLSIYIHEKSPSHLLLGILLPFFLIGILANLAGGEILQKSEIWKKIFDFFSESLLFQTFQKLPWAIFLLLWFLIFYKSLFLILIAFAQWIYKVVFPEFFRGWKDKKTKKSWDDTAAEEDHAEAPVSHKHSHDDHHGGGHH